jgi:selenocysteine lyase/cysteine desulfurase
MITRRACLAAAPAALLTTSAMAAESRDKKGFDPNTPLPHKDAFSPLHTRYLNSASQHPLSLGAKQAVERYMEYRSFSTENDYSFIATYYDVLEKYAQFINADADEVAFVQSTTVGENLVLKALGFPKPGGRIVSDELHYVGSLPTYAQLAELGTDVVTLRASDNGRIDLEQFELAVTDDTDLVAVSLVSMVNGFQHDLKELCRIAHASGALVYADVVHAVGSVPFDVRESGVDFCSAASYKWLMGEQGLGFLFARKDRLAEIERPWFGHYQLDRRSDLGFPSQERIDAVSEYEHANGARGYFAMGSQANIVAAILDNSLDYLLTVGAERIQDYRQPMIDRLQDELPRLGFASITPRDAGTPVVSFRHKTDAKETRDKLHAAGITATTAKHHLRISPSVFNDMDDIDQLVRALG